MRNVSGRDLEVADALERTAEELELEGWRRGRFGSPDAGPRCAAGGLSWAVSGGRTAEPDDLAEPERALFDRAARSVVLPARVPRWLPVPLPAGWELALLVRWNDRPGQTAGRVRTRLRQRARRLRGGA